MITNYRPNESFMNQYDLEYCELFFWRYVIYVKIQIIYNRLIHVGLLIA